MVKKIHSEFMKVVDFLIVKKIQNESIQVIILGGSVARGDETEHSDIDIVFYVKRKEMPSNPRRFYKFKGKYIEEHYFPIEELNFKSILLEEKILYNKTGKIIIPKFDKKWAQKNFAEDLKEAEKYQKLAEKSFKNKNYEQTFYYLYGLGSPAFIVMHALPPKFNLPFPSFRLLESLKVIDKEHKTKTYKIIKQIYTFENRNQILKDFQRAYLLMNKIKRAENPKSKNLGFFDKVKIKYNISGLKMTFENYPFVYAYRFIIGCLAMWTFDKNTNEENRKKLYKKLLKILGVKEINKNLVEKKLHLSKQLLEECERI